jgi:hypothetical protein
LKDLRGSAEWADFLKTLEADDSAACDCPACQLAGKLKHLKGQVIMGKGSKEDLQKLLSMFGEVFGKQVD